VDTFGHIYADLFGFGHVVVSLPCSLGTSISFLSAVMMADRVATYSRYMRTLLNILRSSQLTRCVAFSIRNAS